MEGEGILISESSPSTGKRKAESGSVGETIETCSGCDVKYTLAGERKPKITPCFHTFCYRCLQNAIGKDTLNQLVCILCQKRHSAIKSAVDLPPNYTIIQRLTEAVSAPEAQAEKGAEGTSTSCGLCETTATHKCFQCPEGGELLCELHVAEHKRSKLSRTHNPVPLEEIPTMAEAAIPAAAPAAATDSTNIMCWTHNRTLEAYCDNCSAILCIECTLEKHQGVGHTVALMSTCGEKHEQILKEALRRTKEKLSKMEPAGLEITKMKESIDARKVQLLELSKEITAKLKKAVKETEEKIGKEIEAEANRRVTGLEQQETKMAEATEPLKNLVEITEKLFADNNRMAILSMKNDLVKRLDSVSAGFDVSRPSFRDDFGLSECPEPLQSALKVIPCVMTTSKFVPLPQAQKWDLSATHQTLKEFMSVDATKIGGRNLKTVCTARGLNAMSSGLYFFGIKVEFVSGKCLVGVVDSAAGGSVLNSEKKKFKSGDIMQIALDASTRRIAFGVGNSLIFTEEIPSQYFLLPIVPIVSFEACHACSASFVSLPYNKILLEKIGHTA